MKTEALKTGFWGYKKFSVCQYITAMEQEFSAKLLEQDEESRALLEQERQRSQALEEELNALREQYEAQRSEQLLIANTLVEAQRYAETLKAESEARAQEAEQRLQEELAKREQELEQYTERLNQLRELFRSMLQEMDGSAEHLLLQLQDIKAPDRDISLFCRKPELVV